TTTADDPSSGTRLNPLKPLTLALVHSVACRWKGLWTSPGRIADTGETGRLTPPGQNKVYRHAPHLSAGRHTCRRRPRLDAHQLQRKYAGSRRQHCEIL